MAKWSKHDLAVMGKAFADATFQADDLTADEERALWLLVELRHEAGLLDDEPVSQLDIDFAKFVSLTLRLSRGDDLEVGERQRVGRVLFNLVPEAFLRADDKAKRRLASIMGGKAGRTVDPANVMKAWNRQFEITGKVGAADDLTAREINLSERQVRRIRLGHK